VIDSLNNKSFWARVARCSQSASYATGNG